MTSLWGNDNGGGGSGSNGHRVIVTYTVSQNILGNYSDVSWQYGVDFGDPNYWAGINSRSITWSLTTGASISGVAGSGLSYSDGSSYLDNGAHGGQIFYFASGTARVYHDSNGHGSIHLVASMGFNTGPYTSSIGPGDIGLPDIPQNPAAPSAVTSVRVNDTQATISWTNNSTGTAPYANLKVYRATDGGGFALIQTLGAAVTSYSDTGIAANHKYLYKVSAVGTNTAESAQTAAAAGVFTTPGAPSTLTAIKLAGGDIRLTWANNANYTEHTIRIEESQNGGAYSEITNVASGTTTWDHVAPSTAVTHKYRIRARSTTGSLNSSYSNESATITLLATAAAPTGLDPAGNAKDATEAIVFTWTHNPTDGTPQTAYQLQYKIGAGSFVTVGPTTSGTSSYTMPASTLTNGQTITWHVATAGQNGTIGAYSADSVFTTSARPTSTISTPSGGAYNSSGLTALWTYFQAQSSPQASWHAILYKDNGGGSYTLLEEQYGSGTGTSVTFAYTLLNNTAYAVRVYLTSAAGLESVDAATELESFTTSFLPPAPVALSAAYQWDTGNIIVTAIGSNPVANTQALVLDGTGDWGSTPDAAALDITGNLDLRADIQPTDWTPATHTGIIEKWLTASNLSYALTLDTAGKLRMRITTSGLVATLAEAISSVAVGALDLSRLSVRAARVGTTVTFYTSTDTDLETATWTQLGTTQTLSGTIFVGTSALTIGSNGAGAAFLGKIYSAMVKNAAGTTVAYPIYSTKAAGTTSFSDGFGNTWTLVGNANIALSILGTAAIATVDLQRQIDGGDWITWVAGIVLPVGDLTVNVTDTAPTVNGTNNYRALVKSATPSSAYSAEVPVMTAETLWGFLSTGPGFSQVVRMRARLSLQATVGRDKATYQFAGREDPVELSGEAIGRKWAVLATLFPVSEGGWSSEPEELEDLAETNTIVLWRDYRGRRVFCSLSDVSINYETQANKFPVAFTLTRVSYSENVV